MMSMVRPDCTVVVGAQWGNEGKGKLVYHLSRSADVCARFNGGANNVHTVTVDNDGRILMGRNASSGASAPQQLVFRLFPLGVLHKQCKVVFGNGMMIHLPTLLGEIASIQKHIDADVLDRVYISTRAHVVFDFHQKADHLFDDLRENKLGTSQKGIGPGYSTKSIRNGIRFGDLFSSRSVVKEKVHELLTYFNKYSEFHDKFGSADIESLIDSELRHFEKIKHRVVDTVAVMADFLRSGQKIICEGANSVMSDLDFGTYPYVTSSNTVSGSACIGLGFPPTKISNTIGVCKAYTTRAQHWFPSVFGPGEMESVGCKMLAAGNEVGTTSKVPRKIGWLDLVQLKYAAQVCGFDGFMVTGIDALAGLEKVGIVTGYVEHSGGYPATDEAFKRVKVVVEYMPGWSEDDVRGVVTYEELPDSVKALLDRIEREVKVPVKTMFVSSASSALDALTGMMPNASSHQAPEQPSGEISLTPAKLEFYRAVAAQMAADGFGEESRNVLNRIGGGEAAAASTTPLFSIYSDFSTTGGKSSSRQWTSLRPRPLPPIGPQEQLLDLNVFPELPLVEDDDEQMDASEPQEQYDIIDTIAARRRVNVPKFKTRYTAQHKQQVRSVAVSSDGRLCASGSMDTSIKIMDTSKMRMFGVVTAAAAPGQQQMDELRPVIRTFYDHVGTVSSLAFHPRQPMLFTGSYDKTIKVFDLTRGGLNKKAQHSISDVSPINVVVPHACGDFVLVGTQHPVVRLYDIHTAQCYSSYYQAHQHGGSVLDIAPAADGSVFASASNDGSVILWDGVSNRQINKLVDAHLGHPVTSVQWSRNQRYLLTAGGDHRTRLWDVRTGKELMVYTDQPGKNLTKCESIKARFVQNEDYVVVAAVLAGEAGELATDLTFMDAKSGGVVVPKAGLHPGPVRCIAASPADRTIITGCDDAKVRYIEVIPGDSGNDDE